MQMHKLIATDMVEAHPYLYGEWLYVACVVLVEVGSSPRTYSLTTMGLDYDERLGY